MRPNRMTHTLSILLSLAAVAAPSPPLAAEVTPIKALYVTDYSNFWHDYQEQQATLQEGIGRYINIEFSLVGKDPDDALSMMKQPNFSAGYDVVVYNMCFADDLDTQRIDNIISQTRALGVPAVLLHCTMHSFQATSQNQDWWRWWNR